MYPFYLECTEQLAMKHQKRDPVRKQFTLEQFVKLSKDESWTLFTHFF